MGLLTSKQALDREQAYIRSQTTSGDVGFAATSAALDSSLPKFADLRCCQEIYEQIIQRFGGQQFKTAMGAAVAIERALLQLSSKPTDAEVETIKGQIQDSFGVLTPLDEGIASKMTDCVRDQAQNYDAQSPIRAWLLAFPSKNG